MTNTLPFQSFDQMYQDVVRTIYQFWTPQMQMELAAHNHGWSPDKFDFESYLQASSIRFYKAYRSFSGEENHDQRVCDIGGFWGVFPLTLKKLGYHVTMTESLKYYGDSFNGLFKFIIDQGVHIVDYDPFQPEALPPGHFDIIVIMAVLEHYPHSLRTFMKNIISLLNQSARVYLEVPNIAFWPKRINLLLGRPVLVDIREIFNSEVPFVGHHHEFTISELRMLANLSGLTVLSEHFYNYSPHALPSIKMFIQNPIQYLTFLLLKDSRECLSVLCKLNGQ